MYDTLFVLYAPNNSLCYQKTPIIFLSIFIQNISIFQIIEISFIRNLIKLNLTHVYIEMRYMECLRGWWFLRNISVKFLFVSEPLNGVQSCGFQIVVTRQCHGVSCSNSFRHFDVHICQCEAVWNNKRNRNFWFAFISSTQQRKTVSC